MLQRARFGLWKTSPSSRGDDQLLAEFDDELKARHALAEIEEHEEEEISGSIELRDREGIVLVPGRVRHSRSTWAPPSTRRPVRTKGEPQEGS
ncbi:MAG: hypothetical protein R3B72_07110 [Polyangiaceae bacterium]